MVRETSEFNRPEPQEEPGHVPPFSEMNMDAPQGVPVVIHAVEDAPDLESRARLWLDDLMTLVRWYDHMMAEFEARATAEVDDWSERSWAWLAHNRMKFTDWRQQADKDLKDLNAHLHALRGAARSRADALQVGQRVQTAWETSRAAREQPRLAARQQAGQQKQQLEEPMSTRPPVFVEQPVERPASNGAEPEFPAPPRPIPLRDHALTAWQAARDQRAANQAARHRAQDAREARALQVLAQERLGLDIQSSAGYAEVDGVRLAVRWREQARTYELIVVESCRECGKPAPSEDIRSLADLGAVLDRQHGVQHLCHECRVSQQLVEEPAASDRLIDVMRELVAEEMARQRTPVHASRARQDGRTWQNRPEVQQMSGERSW